MFMKIICRHDGDIAAYVRAKKTKIKDVPLSLQRKLHVNQIGGSAGGVHLQWQSKAQTARFFRCRLTSVSTAVRPTPTIQIQCHLRTRHTAA